MSALGCGQNSIQPLNGRYADKQTNMMITLDVSCVSGTAGRECKMPGKKRYFGSNWQGPLCGC